MMPYRTLVHLAVASALRQFTPAQQQQAGTETPLMFAQITKVDAAKREVWGRLAHEVPDRADEIFDYESSKPHFKAWSEEFAKATDGKSLGNLRAMHGKVAAGKFVSVVFNDAEKAIDVGAKVVDDNEWQKVEQGVYTGFSIGGSYVGERKAEKINGRDVKRYTATPTEGSLVDSPCIPTAKFFDILKADGVIEKVAFKPAALEVTGTDDEVAEFAKAMNEGKLTMADVIVLVKGGKKPADKTVDKGMWNVQDFASVLACVSNIAAMAKDEADWEGDKSPVPEKLRGWLKIGVDIFKAMAKEEADELVASLKGSAGKSVGLVLELHKLGRETKPAELTTEEIAAVTKAAPSDLAKALTDAGVAKAGAASMQKIHDMVTEMGGKCAKGEPTGDLAKITADLAATQAQVKKLMDSPVPYVTLRTVAKGDAKPGATDVSKITIGDLKDDQLIKNADGSVDYATSLHNAREKALIANAALSNS